MNSILLKKLLVPFVFFFSLIATGQQEIKGRVVDAEGVPLPGTSVLVKGTSNGVAADFDGYYAINASQGQTLVFSYVGFVPKEIIVGTRSQIDVALAMDTQVLDDVVVIGYGKQSRNLVSSAVSKVKVEQVESNPSANPIQALQGKVAGLSILPSSGQPGEEAQVFIRGGTQVSGTSSANRPLYIIDGVFRDNMNGLNPHDIESIQVLKDAAATAIYGARAANGIILVTTKSGERNGKGTVSINYRSGIAQQLNRYPWTSAEDYIRVSRIAAAKGINLENPGDRLSNTNFGYSVQTVNNRGNYGFNRNTLAFLDNVIGVEGQAYVADLLENQGYGTMKDPVTGRTMIFKDNNYDDLIFTTAQLQDFNVRFSQGSENGNMNISLGYLKQDGTFLGTGFDRITGLYNGNYDLSDRLSANAGVNFSFQQNTEVQNANNSINRSSRLPHTVRIWNDDGTPALGETTSSPRNRYHELYYQDAEQKTYYYTLNFGLDWNIWDNLHFKPSVSFFRDDYNFNFFERASPEIPGRRAERSEVANNQLLLNGIFTYDRSFGNHNLDLLWGMNYTKNRRESINGSGSNGATDIIETLNASATDMERVSSSIVENKLLSNFGRISYDFNGKYLASASYRIDGASQFAEDNRFAFFPAFSLGWNIHQESFWKSKTLSRLKLRGSWGQAGSLSGLTISDTQGEFSTRLYGFQGGALLTQLPNTALKWETTTSTDIGLDMALFDNRINLLLDVYEKITDDRLIDRPMPQQTGFSSIRDNVGSIRNRGIEVEVGADIIKGEDFQWHTDFNFAFNRTTVVKLPENGRDKNRINYGLVYNENGDLMEVGGLAEGERPYGIWAFDMIGVYATDEEAANAPEDLLVSGSKFGDPKNGGDAIWRDVNNDGVIDNYDMVFVGFATPDKLGGMANTFTYKGLQLRFSMDYAFGHVINNGWRARANANARNNVMTTKDVLRDDFWKEQGDIAVFPRYDNASDFDNGYRNHLRPWESNGNLTPSSSGGSASTLYYHRGDFIAFRELWLGYQFPESAGLDKFGISNLDVSISANNLGYWTKYSGLTPEVFDGLDEGIYPRPFQLIIGLNVSF
ncbi:TonB-dependent receptor [Flagellimonas taeanensis]|uniref:SusC/RagA family TonB-linked outer membrane protein n=1 Tax=Flavobacteriaceae TaxID=49546 RepID=UPI000E691D71|nr:MULTISPECIES: TonB-dependent receptor [Allomuricauda]MDC6384702.1 TonB-dependent receptor [Muricauda sp. SK9]RIV53553.1 TonB-dependent receptor [Allomuricauda taeanensis]